MAHFIPTATSSVTSDDCFTPPPSFKNNLAELPLSPLEPILSSPVTPHAPDRIKSFFPAHSSEERAKHTCLVTISSRHRPVEQSLVPRINAAGNSSYICKRPIIIDWLIDVISAYNFHHTTLHLAVRYMDLFLSQNYLTQSSWQLCAVSALFIAAKCEEAGADVPIVADLMLICDNLYTRDTLRTMELSMLATMKWDLVLKTPVHFLFHYLAIVKSRLETEAGKEWRAAAGLSDNSNEDTRSWETSGSCRDDEHQDDFMLQEEEDSEDDDDDSATDYTMDDCECENSCTCNDYAVEELECSEDLAMVDAPPPKVGRTGSSRREPLEALKRVGLVCLDLSLYDFDFVTSFTPDVIAASALAIAAEVTGECLIHRSDVSVLANLKDAEWAGCYNQLFRQFNAEAKG